MDSLQILLLVVLAPLGIAPGAMVGLMRADREHHRRLRELSYGVTFLLMNPEAARTFYATYRDSPRWTELLEQEVKRVTT